MFIASGKVIKFNNYPGKFLVVGGYLDEINNKYVEVVSVSDILNNRKWDVERYNLDNCSGYAIIGTNREAYRKYMHYVTGEETT